MILYGLFFVVARRIGNPVLRVGIQAFSLIVIAGHWRNWRADRCCDEATSCSTTSMSPEV